jgi:hypothetical protein
MFIGLSSTLSQRTADMLARLTDHELTGAPHGDRPAKPAEAHAGASGASIC